MSFRNFIPTVWSAQMLKSLKNDNVAVRLSDARYRSDSQSRHISKRMQLHIMCEIHKEICRLRYGGEPVE